MAGFPEHRRAMTDAAFVAFGEDAVLVATASMVRVRFKSQDEEQRFAGVSLVERVPAVRFRSWEVAQPAVGLVFVVEAGPNAGRYVIAAQPLLDDKGVWRCTVDRSAP